MLSMCMVKISFPYMKKKSIEGAIFAEDISIRAINRVFVKIVYLKMKKWKIKKKIPMESKTSKNVNVGRRF